MVRARARGRFHPGRGEHDLARGTFHQRQPQLVLELADLGGQGGLADEAGGGRLAEMAVVGQRHQILQIT